MRLDCEVKQGEALKETRVPKVFLNFVENWLILGEDAESFSNLLWAIAQSRVEVEHPHQQFDSSPHIVPKVNRIRPIFYFLVTLCDS